MARDGLLPSWAARVSRRRRVPHITTIATGVVVALGALVADENEIYDLTNIGTLSAFAIVCIGVLVLRYVEPDRRRPFRVPFVWPVAMLGSAACLYTMAGLPRTAWERFGIWLVLGVILYASYGYQRSGLRARA
jgi:APA family basic amino acid/polyamine antiporter